VNTDETHPVGPAAFFRSLARNRELVLQLIRQEISGRYRGSIVGVAWSLLTPLLMLAIYTFVFSVIFGARWTPGVEQSRGEFAVILFAGLAVFNVFADCVVRAPTLILSNANYVSRVVFPLELLPVVAMGNALFHFCASMVVWVVVAAIVMDGLPVTALLLPAVMVPLVLATLGVSWLLASLGVYLRDVSQFTTIIVTGLLFLSPIFYPLEAVPEKYRGVLLVNPMGYVVQSAREVLVHGQIPGLGFWLLATAMSGMVAALGFWWFQKTRKGFADVI
jgi:lipopolysaccharide transport system permease protein